MGDLKCGFEEMQGVKLGYLLIKGKQMFALSQVFTDLLQNIPRTTVHKRMDHLNVKKHHCDLEELRKLKAINSIAFHAAKCTLISREDVEALYFSCKTERVLKSNKRKVKGDAREELLHQDTRARSWKEKVWFSLHSVPKTLPLHNKAGSRESPLLPDSNLPQIYNKKHNQEYSSVSESDYKPFKNYETAQITGNCVSYNQRHSFFRSVVNRQPVFLQSAIAQSKLSGAATDLLHKRKRRREEVGCRDSARRSWSRSRHTHQPPLVLVQPKCCIKPKRHSNDSLGAFHLGHDFYLNHGSLHGFQENYSSDTESSSYSERVNNDSDFGSSLSSSSNSGTSDEEQEESLSESSDISTDEEESSSQSDSSSVSSLVSVQSIRFRRPRFTSLPKTKSLNAKTLVLQPTFHYNQQLPPPRTPGEQVGGADSDRLGKQLRHESANREAKQDSELQQTPKFVSPGQGSLFTETVRGGDVTDTHCDPKSAGPVKTSFYLQGLSPSASRSKVFPSCRTPGAAGVSPPGSGAHCSHLKETMFLTSTDRHLSLFMHLKRETQTGSLLKLPSPLKSIKTEPEDSLVMGPHSESSRAAKTLPSALQNVKIKVEESSKEYEYASQACRFQCKGDETDVNNDRYPGGDIKHADYYNYKTKGIESSTEAPRSPSLQECRSTQDTPRPEEGEYTNGARVRKNNRTLVLAEKPGISRTQTKPNVSKVDSKTPCSRPAGKAESSEGNAEELTGASKRKRTFNNVASSLKRSFSFMANFPSPPSLVVGSDGDLSPAFSLNSLRNSRPPPRSHPVWQWQPGGRPVSPPPAPKFRKC